MLLHSTSSIYIASLIIPGNCFFKGSGQVARPAIIIGFVSSLNDAIVRVSFLVPDGFQSFLRLFRSCCWCIFLGSSGLFVMDLRSVGAIFARRDLLSICDSPWLRARWKVWFPSSPDLTCSCDALVLSWVWPWESTTELTKYSPSYRYVECPPMDDGAYEEFCRLDERNALIGRYNPSLITYHLFHLVLDRSYS